VLGRKLEEVEARWRAWLLPETTVGLVQRLERKAMAGLRATDPAERRSRRCCAHAGSRSKSLRPRSAPSPSSPELSQAAAMHARYLVLHPEQQTAWPAAHEEYPDQQGFSPKGAQAGLRSVIHFHQKPAQAIEGWLGTFYHRLPLLDPGLFGLGYAESDGVIVMDVGSLSRSRCSITSSCGRCLTRPTCRCASTRRFRTRFRGRTRARSAIRSPCSSRSRGQGRDPPHDGGVGRHRPAGRSLGGALPLPGGTPVREPRACQRLVLHPAAPLEKKTRYKVSAYWTGGSKGWCFTTGE
jgi:hypothetical protein